MTEQEVREALARIAGAVGDKDEGDKISLTTFARAMKESAHPLYQHVFNVGHSERHKKATSEEKGLREQLTEREAEITRLSGELDTARQGQPDAAKRVTELEGQIRTLQQQHADEKKALSAKVTQARKSAKLETVKAELIEQGMDPVYADVLVQTQEIQDRVHAREDDDFDFLQGNGIPFAAGDGQKPYKLLASEFVERTRREKPILITSNAEAGSGTGGAGGRANDRQSGTDAKFFDRIREDVKQQQTATKPEGGSARERMGIQRIGTT